VFGRSGYISPGATLTPFHLAHVHFTRGLAFCQINDYRGFPPSFPLFHIGPGGQRMTITVPLRGATRTQTIMLVVSE
jgi:hypothetical protein